MIINLIERTKFSASYLKLMKKKLLIPASISYADGTNSHHFIQKTEFTLLTKYLGSQPLQLFDCNVNDQTILNNVKLIKIHSNLINRSNIYHLDLVVMANNPNNPKDPIAN